MSLWKTLEPPTAGRAKRPRSPPKAQSLLGAGPTTCWATVMLPDGSGPLHCASWKVWEKMLGLL